MLVPCTLKEASAFVDRHHRHHPAPQGGLFAVAVATGDEVVAVAIVGRPVARELQDGWTAEVVRLCAAPRLLHALPLVTLLGLHGALTLPTPALALLCAAGMRNACSMLYGAAWRAARALGYRKMVTYILAEEAGLSLRAAGWRCVGEAGGGSWSCPSRPRVDLHPTQTKLRWEREEASRG